MKKSKLLILFVCMCLIAVLSACLFGCGKNKGDQQALQAPQNVRVEGRNALWDEVEGANGYRLYLNDGEANQVAITATSVSLDDSKVKPKLIANTENTLFVKAVALSEDGEVTNESDWSSVKFNYTVTGEAKRTVTFNLNYPGASPSTVKVDHGQKVAKPSDPKRTGYTFEGWYMDAQCVLEAKFSGNNSEFTVTSDITLYAKWKEVQVVIVTTPVYAYVDDWTAVYVKAFNGATELTQANGVLMSAVSGKTNWYTAEINEEATSVIFTDGTNATSSLQFSKSAPYYKDGEWLAQMPAEPVITEGYYIAVNGGTPVALDPNPEKENEYMILDIDLDEGDVVVVYKDGTALEYNPECNFSGTVAVAGKYSFYATESVWASAPAAPASYKLTVGDAASSFTENTDTDKSDGRLAEYVCKVTLNVGDAVKISDGAGNEYNVYENDFTGTAAATGEYTFYLKIYEGSHKIWVTMPVVEKVVTVSVNGGEPVKLTINPDNANEYMYLGLNLAVGDKVVITKDGTEVTLYKPGCGFNGTATDAGLHDFYVDVTQGIWVTTAYKVYYYYNADKWAEVYAYAWDESVTPTLENASWPGVKMSAVAGKADWYSIKVSVKLKNIVFTNNVGSQTSDLTIPANDNVYYKGDKWQANAD